MASSYPPPLCHTTEVSLCQSAPQGKRHTPQKCMQTGPYFFKAQPHSRFLNPSAPPPSRQTLSPRLDVWPYRKESAPPRTRRTPLAEPHTTPDSEKERTNAGHDDDDDT